MSVKNMSNYLCISTPNDTGLINEAHIIPDVEKLTFPCEVYSICINSNGHSVISHKCYLDVTLDLDYV